MRATRLFVRKALPDLYFNRVPSLPATDDGSARPLAEDLSTGSGDGEDIIWDAGTAGTDGVPAVAGPDAGPDSVPAEPGSVPAEPGEGGAGAGLGARLKAAGLGTGGRPGTSATASGNGNGHAAGENSAAEAGEDSAAEAERGLSG